MTKPNSPLLSFGAHGTIANSLTFQQRQTETVARSKPVPSQPRSLKQMYQRWDYLDAIAAWSALDAAQKLAYRKLGSTRHLTAFAAFMQYELQHLPNLLCRLTLDEPTGLPLIDTSKYEHSFTVHGTIGGSGNIATGRYFDGLDDYIDADQSYAELNVTQSFTMMIFARPEATADYRVLATLCEPPTAGYVWQFNINNIDTKVFVYFNNIAPGPYWGKNVTTAIPIYPDRLTHLALVYDHTVPDAYVYYDGILQPATTSGTPSSSLLTGNTILRIGRAYNNVWHAKGDRDHFQYFNKALTQPDILRHASRRYP